MKKILTPKMRQHAQSQFFGARLTKAREAHKLFWQQNRGENPITKDDLKLVDAYIKKHGVTKCPPMTFSPHIAPF